MKNYLRMGALGALLLGAAWALQGCGGEEPGPSEPTLTGRQMMYPISAAPGFGVSGMLTFAERSDQSTLVSIHAMGTQEGAMHHAHLHYNDYVTDGGVAVSLSHVMGGMGHSETVVTELNNGTRITYEEFLAFSGHVKLHLSADQLSTIIAYGDFGAKALTGSSAAYPLAANGASGVSGTATLEERADGTARLRVALQGLAADSLYPVQLWRGTVAEPGELAITLRGAQGPDGTVLTNIDRLNDGTAIGYSGLEAFDGHIRVYLSATSDSVVAQGDVGANFGG